MTPIGNHPYAFWEPRWEPRLQQVILHFACSACGDRTEWRCSRPQLQNYRAMQYAGLHAHGLRPMAPQQQDTGNMTVAYGPPAPLGGWRERMGR